MWRLQVVLVVALFIPLLVQAQTLTNFPAEFRQMCFTKDDNIYLQDLKAGTTKLIRKGSDPHLSPSGKFIAYTVYAKGKNPNDPDRTIQVLNLETNQTQGFKSLNKVISYGAVWSPNETHLALNIFTNNAWQVGILNPVSGELRILTQGLPGINDAFLSSWLPDSKSIVCADLSNVYEIDLAGKILQKISLDKLPNNIGGISSATKYSLSNNKRYLLFDVEDPDIPSSIHIYDLAQKTFSRITPRKVVGGEPQWLPGEKEIVFTSFRQVNKRKATFDVYKIMIGATVPTLLARDASSISFSR